MSVINATPLLAAAGGDYQISRSVRLRSSASAYFNRTSGSTTNQTTWTYSAWIKRGALSTGEFISASDSTGGTNFDAIDVDSNTFRVYFNGTSSAFLVTTAVYRDPSAWYHLVVSVDTTQATASNRIKMYVNGVQVTSFSTSTYPSQNYATFFNLSGRKNTIGANAQTSPGQFFDGYLTEINFIDGQALTPSSFGETDSITGVWKPKKYAGTYGTNGFYLNFSDNSSNTATTIGKDYSGNGNNWTPNNISVTAGVTYDSMLDVPTLYADGGNGRGNYAVLNPLDTSSDMILKDGNLFFQYVNASQHRLARSTFLMSSGKWYAEFLPSVAGCLVGVASPLASLSNYLGATTGGVGYGGADGGQWADGAFTASRGATYGSGDVIGIALDKDNNTVAFYKNGVLQFTYTGLNSAQPYCIATGLQNSYGNFNFGQRPFSYTPPTGFKALNTQNLPDSTIKNGNQYFDVSLYTGNGSSGGQTITNSGAMQPDFVWLKARSLAGEHQLFDAVRGGTKYLVSNNTNAEQTGAGITFNSNGFALAGAQYNDNAMTVASWQWKESPSAGFDIVTYTSNGNNNVTVNHSLGVAPAMIIAKYRSGSGGSPHWYTYHKNLSSGNVVALNLTNAAFSSPALFSSVGSSSFLSNMNAGTDTFVAYLFAEVAGFSKAFSYTGNGSSDGPFVFCGFKPAFIMIKRTDTTGNWTIHDNRRLGYNGSSASKELYPNLSNAEGSDSMDQLSNGFKLRDTYADVNASGGTYIGFAFAESPFRNSLAR